jgi:hypothetical protein
MVHKPESIEEIEKDLTEHPARGKVNGIEICDISTSPLHCEIDGETYNALILLRGAIGYNKSQIATEAIKEFLQTLIFNKKNKIQINYVEVGGVSLYRGQVSRWIYSRCIELGKESGLSVRQVCTAALRQYSNKPENKFLIQEFLESKAIEIGCEEKEIETAIYGFSKRVSREERLKRLKAGRDVDKKMDI